MLPTTSLSSPTTSLTTPLTTDAVSIRHAKASDYGRVIGKGGRTANALRTVVKAAAVKEQRRVLVDIVD